MWAIKRRDLAVGSKLPSEASLSRAYGVSRSVVREALRTCADLGLTKTMPGKGTFVVANLPTDRPIDQEIAASRPMHDLTNSHPPSALELLEARRVIEIPAARWAAERRSPEELATMEEIAALMLGTDEPARWRELHTRFHSAIAGASGNPVIQAFQAQLWVALPQQSSNRRRASNRHDLAILQAIRAGSRDAAEAAMAEHLADGGRARGGGRS